VKQSLKVIPCGFTVLLIKRSEKTGFVGYSVFIFQEKLTVAASVERKTA
jgi:hypothetical protein